MQIREAFSWGINYCIMLKVEYNPGNFGFWYWNIHDSDWSGDPPGCTREEATELFFAFLKEERFTVSGLVQHLKGQDPDKGYHTIYCPTLWEHLDVG